MSIVSLELRERRIIIYPNYFYSDLDKKRINQQERSGKQW